MDHRAADTAAGLAVYKGDRDSFNAAKYVGACDNLIGRMSPAQLTTAAEQGVVLAQARLGVLYGLGQAVAQDDTEAVRWHRQAAEQGNADAEYYLGLHYYEGRGIEQDAAQAMAWYTKAAEQGHAQAQFNLGFLYANGTGGEQNDTQTANWYRRAAKQGTPLHYVQAYLWIDLATTGSTDAKKPRRRRCRATSPNSWSRSKSKKYAS